MPKGRKLGGREKGTPNKLTRAFKEILLEAVDTLNSKPDTSLLSFGLKNPKEFWQIAAKLIPTELNAKITGEVNIVGFKTSDGKLHEF